MDPSTEGPALLHSKALAQPGYGGCSPPPPLPTVAPAFRREFLSGMRTLPSLGSERLEHWGSSTGQVPWGSSDLGGSLSDRKVEALQPETGRPHPAAPKWALNQAYPTTRHFSSNAGFSFLYLLSRVRYVTANQSFSSA